MTDFNIANDFLNLQHRAEDVGLTVWPGASSFIIQNKALRILSTPKTIDGIGAYLDAVEYASRKDFKGFN